MKTTITTKEIIKLAGAYIAGVADTADQFFDQYGILGRLGQRELGVNGITGIFYLMLSMIGYGLSSGIQVQMARRGRRGQ